jgi:hypothetical protein
VGFPPNIEFTTLCLGSLNCHFIKPLCSAFSFGEKGAKEKAWQKEIRR